MRYRCEIGSLKKKVDVKMFETIFAIFAIGFLGVAVGVGVVCLMVWMALNED